MQKKEIRANGIRVMLSGHPEIRRLKRLYTPTVHGNKFWTSSWLIMHFLKNKGLGAGTRVLEVGCGWGLASIYCAKKLGATVTGTDVDAEVFPFLEAHAHLNKVRVTPLQKSFEGLRGSLLSDFDVLIGADICFWEEMVDPLKRLIRRARRAGVQKVLIADPGRAPFESLAHYFLDKKQAEVRDWSVKKPRPIHGRLMAIGFE